jgi:hypothetical protein
LRGGEGIAEGDGRGVGADGVYGSHTSFRLTARSLGRTRSFSNLGVRRNCMKITCI